jgi:hypothetical protein
MSQDQGRDRHRKIAIACQKNVATVHVAFPIHSRLDRNSPNALDSRAGSHRRLYSTVRVSAGKVQSKVLPGVRANGSGLFAEPEVRVASSVLVNRYDAVVGESAIVAIRVQMIVHMLAIRARNEVQAGEPSQLGDARHIADGRLRESRLASEQ